jgi:peptide deformylase
LAVLEIIQEGHPVLRRKAQPVAKITKRLVKLAKDMTETMYAAKGVGLAAPQVNVSERLIVVDAGQGLVVLFNPEIAKTEGGVRDVEACLSIPNRSGYVTRAAQIVVKGLNEQGKHCRFEAIGCFARALQHEIDHLNGILFIDRLEEGDGESR